MRRLKLRLTSVCIGILHRRLVLVGHSHVDRVRLDEDMRTEGNAGRAAGISAAVAAEV